MLRIVPLLEASPERRGPANRRRFLHDYEAGTVEIFNDSLGDHSSHNLDLPAKTFAGALTQSHLDSDLRGLSVERG